MDTINSLKKDCGLCKHCNLETSFSVGMKNKSTILLLFLKYAFLKPCAHVNVGVWLNIYSTIYDMNDDTCNIIYTLANYRLNNNQSNKTTKQNPFLNLCSLTNFRVSKIIFVLYKYRYNVLLKHYLLASLSLSLS